MASCCLLISTHSQNLWRYVSRLYSYQGMRLSEIGVTNDLIFRIVDFYAGYPGTCDVYVNHARLEKHRGADIDLTIFDAAGKGARFCIQSKIMNSKGLFYDIKKWNTRGAQYVKLINWAISQKAMPLYLLYCGTTPASTRGSADYGLSIIDANVISNYRRQQSVASQLPNTTGIPRPAIPDLSFDMLFPLGMDPFQVLFCPGTPAKYIPDEFITLNDPTLEIGLPYIKVIRSENERPVPLNESEVKKYEAMPMYKIVIKNDQLMWTEHEQIN